MCLYSWSVTDVGSTFLSVNLWKKNDSNEIPICVLRTSLTSRQEYSWTSLLPNLPLKWVSTVNMLAASIEQAIKWSRHLNTDSKRSTEDECLPNLLMHGTRVSVCVEYVIDVMASVDQYVLDIEHVFASERLDTASILWLNIMLLFFKMFSLMFLRSDFLFPDFLQFLITGNKF